MTNEECRTALKRIAGYMCAKKDLEALTYAMNELEHISSGLAKNSKTLENIGKLDCISRKRAIERLKLNLPISDGTDNSRDRHRYMQSLADIQAIREMPSVTPQDPKIGHWKLVQRGKFIDICCSNCEAPRVKDYAYNYTIDQLDNEDVKKRFESNDMRYCPNCGSRNEVEE